MIRSEIRIEHMVKFSSPVLDLDLYRNALVILTYSSSTLTQRFAASDWLIDRQVSRF